MFDRWMLLSRLEVIVLCTSATTGGIPLKSAAFIHLRSRGQISIDGQKALLHEWRRAGDNRSVILPHRSITITFAAGVLVRGKLDENL